MTRLHAWRERMFPPISPGGFIHRALVELELLLWRIAEPNGHRRPRADWLRRHVVSRVSRWWESR